MAKQLTILGSTGSIGVSTLRAVRSSTNDFIVYGLACRSNINLLERQINEFHPEVVAVGSPDSAGTADFHELIRRFPDIEFLAGEEGVLDLAGRKTDICLSAIVGAAGLKPSLAAIERSGRIALANKETMVMAGPLFMERIKQNSVELIPVDSEHSAIFSLLGKIDNSEVERVILTASGGGLRDHPLNKLSEVELDQALDHPTWEMGKKITIDSATMMNKGLEVIEAHFLFDFPYEKISVVIHPESVVHSMIETIDGSIYAHIGVTDMALPILAALTYPERSPNRFGRLKLEEIGHISFSSVDERRYPALSLCYTAGKRGGTLPAVLNAANEIAVESFLKKKILFTDIVKIVEKTMERHKPIDDPNLENILEADREARDISKSIITGE